jgi:Zn-dependent protease
MNANVEGALVNVSLLWMLTAPHEFAHAWVATRLGDDTPLREGRVTLNPLAHVDWLGTVILPALMSLVGSGFLGWGKPVNTNPAKLRGGLNGLAMVALAGPFSNVIFAVVLALVAVAAGRTLPGVAGFAAHGVYLSLYLAIFNMIPVPPLDGSKLLLALRIPFFIYRELAQFGFVLLLLLVSYTNVGHQMSLWSIQGTEHLFRLFQ